MFLYHFICFTLSHFHILPQNSAESASFCGGPSDSPPDVDLRAITLSAAQRIGKALDGVDSAKELILEEYLQKMISYFVEPKSVYAFLVACIIQQDYF